MNYFWGLIFLLLPLAGQIYISLRTWQLLPHVPLLRIAVVAIMALAFIAFFVSMSGKLETMPVSVAAAFYKIGTSWLIILLYLVMFYLLADILMAVHVLPRAYMKASWVGSAVVFIFFVGLFSAAYLHYNHKKRVEITLDSHGKVKRPMRVVMISDIHLGYHNSRADLHRWLQLISNEHPAALLIAGDLIDGRLRPVLNENMAGEFKALPYPVIAIPGNHDYYTGIVEDMNFCRQAGITILRDSIATLGDVQVVGRDDRTNTRRLPLSQLMTKADRSKYIIEMDHQPYHLEEAQNAGIDFEFAGHTHYGQVWPISWITDAIYEDAFGPLTKGNTQYWVSSGLGIWGAKFRIGTRSEYIVATIK